MRTVTETPTFIKYAAEVWSAKERGEFSSRIAENPEAGDLIAGSGGSRKERWAASVRGKRGGARVIYFLQQGHTVWLLIVYTQANFDDPPTDFLVELKKGIENAL